MQPSKESNQEGFNKQMTLQQSFEYLYPGFSMMFTVFCVQGNFEDVVNKKCNR